jgi:hypothetical protein
MLNWGESGSGKSPTWLQSSKVEDGVFSGMLASGDMGVRAGLDRRHAALMGLHAGMRLALQWGGKKREALYFGRWDAANFSELYGAHSWKDALETHLQYDHEARTELLAVETTDRVPRKGVPIKISILRKRFVPESDRALASSCKRDGDTLEVRVLVATPHAIVTSLIRGDWNAFGVDEGGKLLAEFESGAERDVWIEGGDDAREEFLSAGSSEGEGDIERELARLQKIWWDTTDPAEKKKLREQMSEVEERERHPEVPEEKLARMPFDAYCAPHWDLPGRHVLLCTPLIPKQPHGLKVAAGSTVRLRKIGKKKKARDR